MHLPAGSERCSVGVLAAAARHHQDIELGGVLEAMPGHHLETVAGDDDIVLGDQAHLEGALAVRVFGHAEHLEGAGKVEHLDIVEDQNADGAGLGHGASALRAWGRDSTR